MNKNPEYFYPLSKRPCFERIYFIDRRIREGKYPNTLKLAEDLDVKQRTIERDIEHMRDRLGADIEYDRRRKGYYYTSNDFRLSPLKLSQEEATILFIGQKLLIQCAGTPFENFIRSACDKVAAQLPIGISMESTLIEKTLSFDVMPLRGDDKKLSEIFSRLANAIRSETTVWLNYFSASKDEITKRSVDPYHLRHFQGAWYLIGFCHLRDEVRTFAIDRILDLKETDQHFNIHADFSLKKHLASSMGIEAGGTLHEVSIYFDSYQARYIRERIWHGSQKIEDKDDGSLILHFKVSGLGEVKRWVLGFGSHAIIVKPESLRQDVKDEIRKAEVLYERESL
jgi:predicted DNA-binding transcriptional regulator YafY